MGGPLTEIWDNLFVRTKLKDKFKIVHIFDWQLISKEEEHISGGMGGLRVIFVVYVFMSKVEGKVLGVGGVVTKHMLDTKRIKKIV